MSNRPDARGGAQPTPQQEEGRDAHINSGMEGGMQEAMDHLEEVATSLR